MRRAMLFAVLVFGFESGVARADDNPVAPLDPLTPGDPVTPISWLRSRLGGTQCCPPTLGSPFYPPGSIPNCPPVPGTIAPLDPTQPNVPPNPPNTPNELTTPFATPTGAGGLQGRTFNEMFDGDFGGVFYSRTIVGSRVEYGQTGTTNTTVWSVGQYGQVIQKTVSTPVYGYFTTPGTQTVRVPVAGGYSGVSITDNDSARPVDRVYFGYNYYDGFGAVPIRVSATSLKTGR